MKVAAVCHPPPSHYQPPQFVVPAGACDAHCHVTPADYAAVTADASYQPQPAPPQALEHMRAALGLQRSVVVQASVYGLDNRGVEAALRRDPHHLRGVVVARADVSDAQLDAWHRLGVRGMRFILSGQLGGTVGIEDMVALAPRLAERGWHAEFLPRQDEWDEVLPVVSRLPCTLVVDHLGGVPAESDDPGPQAALDHLLGEGRTWLKLIGYRLSSDLADPRLAARAQRFYRRAPDRMVWGSDWPHVGLADRHDAGALLNAFAAWFDHDPAVLARVLATNPRSVFDFPADAAPA